MTSLSSLRFRLATTVLIFVAPAIALTYWLELPSMAFIIGLAALGAAWIGGERFVLRQVRILLNATNRLKAGDLASRTGLKNEPGELGELAQKFDEFAAELQERMAQQEKAEKSLLNRAMQQTVVAAIGQFAISSRDLGALLEQTAAFIAQTLEVEYSAVLELSPDDLSLLLRAGTGWKPDHVGHTSVPTDPEFHEGSALISGEPVIAKNFIDQPHPRPSQLLQEHGVVSGVSVAVGARSKTYGVIGVYTTTPRTFNGDDIHFLLAVANVLAMAIERKHSEADSQKLAVFAQLNPNPAMELSEEGNITYFNDAALQLALSVGHSHPRSILPANTSQIAQECLVTMQSRLNFQVRSGSRVLSWSFHPMAGMAVIHCYIEDITNQLNLEAQLRQSQKMESVGQLAAGVAHDFNNMLTVIQGHAGILLAKPDLPEKVADSIQAVYFASERAASLTRQLLMFSRKNIMQAQSLDLRHVIIQMSKMLKRLLGETIVLQFHPPEEIPVVYGDTGMIEQVLMNLSVNARDAMPRGGTLSIALDLVNFDDSSARSNPEARPGQFVCLRVSDNGTGMDNATMRRIFEPFFTTKEPGKGTGLGLATVYGIVKQHEGWIEVSSELGQGTTFRVFLPAGNKAAVTSKEIIDPTAHIQGGNETILLVEDELVLRDLAVVILRDCGYRVLEAATGVEAIEVWNRHHNAIDLVLTDMVMPEGISGVELAEKLSTQKPEIHVIFTSGYSVDEMDTSFIRDGRGDFLQKPYTRSALAKAVRDCLDRVSIKPPEVSK